MEGNIYIYGDIYHDQSDYAKEYGCVSLKTVTDQINAQKEAETLVVHIHSRGGDVNEGWAIHDALLATGKTLITINEGMVGSIATVPYLAAKKENRKSLPNAKTFIHNPWGGLMGDSKEVAKYAEDLKKEEDKLAQFYADQTEGDLEEIKAQMDKETEFTADEAKALGYVGSISEPLKAVAHYKPKKSNKIDMSNIETQIEEQKSLLKTILGKLGMDKKALAYTLEDGSTIETNSEDALAEGQVIMMDGAAVGEGTYTLEDGKVVTTDAEGVVVSIVEEEVEEEESEEMAALKAENEDLKARVDAMDVEAKKQNELFAEVKGEVEKLAKLQSTYKPKAEKVAFKKKEVEPSKEQSGIKQALKDKQAK